MFEGSALGLRQIRFGDFALEEAVEDAKCLVQEELPHLVESVQGYPVSKFC